MKRLPVRLTEGAERDLAGIYRYIASADGDEPADAMLELILQTADPLSTMPERGSIPEELRSIGVPEYRQLLAGRYRVVCRVLDDTVYIVLIADSRRDMQSLLFDRLVGGD